MRYLLRRLVLSDKAKTFEKLGFHVSSEGIIRFPNLELMVSTDSQQNAANDGDARVLSTLWTKVEDDIRPGNFSFPEKIMGCKANLSPDEEIDLCGGTEENRPHPNGSQRIDHLVVNSNRPLVSEKDLQLLGLTVKRVRTDVYPGMRMSFLTGCGVTLELIGPVEEKIDEKAEEKIWGLAIDVKNIQQTFQSPTFREDTKIISRPKKAVQPGRMISSIRKVGSLRPSLAIAFLSRSPRSQL
eukprot:g2870.t1